MAFPVLVGGTSGVTNTAINITADAQITRLVSVSLFNPGAAIAFVNFYDTDIAPTLGTTVPKWSFGLNTLANRDILLTGDGASFFKGLWVSASTLAGGNVAPATAQNVNISISS